MTAPRAAVVICTRNRARQLERSLESVLRTRIDTTWELIVVDNGSTDDTAAVLKLWETERPGRLRTVVEPRPGLSRARNRGLLEATAPIVAFTDDDCYPEEDWLSRIIARFDESPDLGYLGGRILLHDPVDLPMTILRHAERRSYAPGSIVPPGEIQGANIAFRRAALEEIGGFDVGLGAGTDFPCEDIDALARISAAGWSGAYDPGPVVYHHHGRQSKTEVQSLLQSYLAGSGAYYAKCLRNRGVRHACARFLVKRIFTKPRYAIREIRGAFRYWQQVREQQG